MYIYSKREDTHEETNTENRGHSLSVLTPQGRVIHIYIYIYINIHVHVCIYVYIYIYIYTHTHTHTHTYASMRTHVLRNQGRNRDRSGY